jgi:hypothetical protein
MSLSAMVRLLLFPTTPKGLMTETLTQPPEKVLKIGPDRVTIKSDEVIIEARHEMPDWSVRELNHVPLYFGENKYYLVEKSKARPPYAARYVLMPWPDGQSTSAKGLYTYDLEAVTEREQANRSGNFDDLGRAFLMPFYPFLGLLWSDNQKGLIRFGFVPHIISGVSIFVCFGFVLAQGIFAVILLNAGARAGHFMIGGFIRAMVSADYLHVGPVSIPVILLDTLRTLALLLDVPIRFARYFHEDQWCGGFLEWIVRRGPRED